MGEPDPPQFARPAARSNSLVAFGELRRGPKIVPRGPKITPRGTKITVRGAKIAPRGPKEASKTAKIIISIQKLMLQKTSKNQWKIDVFGSSSQPKVVPKRLRAQPR